MGHGGASRGSTTAAELSEVLSVFHALTGLRAVARTVQGAPVGGCDLGGPRFCRLVRDATPGGPQRCRGSVVAAARSACGLSPRVFTCHAGLTEGVVRLPAPEGDAALATCGPVLLASASPQARAALVERGSALGADPIALRVALDELRPMALPEFENALALLSALLQWHAAQHGGGCPLPACAPPRTDGDTRAGTATRDGDESMGASEAVMAAFTAGGGLEGLAEAMAVWVRPRLGESWPQPRARALELVGALCRIGARLGLSAEATDAAAVWAAPAIAGARGPEDLELALRRVVSALLGPEPQQPWSAHVVEEVVAYVERNYHRPLRLEDAARHVHRSPTYVSALFRRERGISFTQFVRQVRLARAQEMLSEPERSIEAVAEAVGFTDAHYFSRVFSRAVGLPPAEFRRRQLQAPRS